MIPKQIGDGIFVINEKIGAGSYGEVYKATMKNGKQVAIKFEAIDTEKKYLEKEINVSLIFSLVSC